MPAQGVNIPLVLHGKAVGVVSVVQDFEGGITINGGTFECPDLSSTEFLNLAHMEFAFRHQDPMDSVDDSLKNFLTEEMRARMPCNGQNANVCAAEGCFGQSCLKGGV